MIENEIQGSLTEKAEKLKFRSKSELSKIINCKVLPSLDKILSIEQDLGINILSVNIPINVNLDEYLKKKDSTSGDQTTYLNIKGKFGNKFDELLNELQKTFPGNIGQDELVFKARITQGYVSINLVPIGKVKGGIHLMMIKHKSGSEVLTINFMTPDDLLERQIAYENYSLVKIGLNTTYVPAKNRGDENYLMKGQPVMLIKEITDDIIEKVCFLAMKVYEIQTGKI